jgi:hypothetical protein
MPSGPVHQVRKRINKRLKKYESKPFNELNIVDLIKLLYSIYLDYIQYKNLNILTSMQVDRFKVLSCILRNLIDMSNAIINIGRNPTLEERTDIYNQYNVVNLELRTNGVHIDADIWFTVEELTHFPPLPPILKPPILFQLPIFIVIPPSL